MIKNLYGYISMCTSYSVIIVKTNRFFYENYCCVVYTKSEDEQSAEVESSLHHGNAKSFTQPYIRH